MALSLRRCQTDVAGSPFLPPPPSWRVTHGEPPASAGGFVVHGRVKHMDSTKVCPVCKEEKSWGEYYLRSDGKPQSRCKVCYSIESKEKWKARSPEQVEQERTKRRERHLTNQFGISQTTYDEMLAAQEGVCAICRRSERIRTRSGKYRSLAVDHCHTTGEVRGLLCQSCNTGLGKLDDDPQLLLKAVTYLEGHSNAPESD